jgi:hypothetical protein
MPTGPYIPRHTGLSKNVSVKPLLTAHKKLADARQQINIREPDDPAAPPLSDSSDDDATSRRGDIQRTTFGSKAAGAGAKRPPYSTRKSSRTSTGLNNASKRPPESSASDDDIEEPVKKAKRGKGEKPELGSHFGTNTLRRRAAAPKASYGALKNGYSKSAKPLSDLDDSSSHEKPKRVFKPVPPLDDLSSPEKPKGKLIVPDVDSDLFNTPSPKKTFKAPPQLQVDLDTPSPKKTFKHPPPLDDSLLDSSPDISKTKATTTTKSYDPKKAREERLRKKAEKEAMQKRLQALEKDDSPKAVFKMPPPLDSQFDLGDLGSGPEPDMLEPELQEPLRDISPAYPDEAKCPMCGAPVEQELLDKFSSTKYMNISQQHKFCIYHKSKSARQTWVDRGYPDINWSKLNERIAKYHGHMEDILNGATSHYGTVFSKNVRAGKNRTLLKTEQNLKPGYYGSRGLRIMTENLIGHFSSLLRKVAVQDRLVSARGSTSFVQFVLVPELAVRLIMEDMGVKAAKARTIMQESMEIGDLLNEEEEDVVVDVDEDGHNDRGSTSPLSSLGDDDMSDASL